MLARPSPKKDTSTHEEAPQTDGCTSDRLYSRARLLHPLLAQLIGHVLTLQLGALMRPQLGFQQLERTLLLAHLEQLQRPLLVRREARNLPNHLPHKAHALVQLPL